MDTLTLYQHCLTAWTDRVRSLTAEHWDRPTPCDRWTVRDLVNHVVGEDLWCVALLEGATPEQVGDRFDGDLVGDDPVAAALAAAAAARSAVAHRLPQDGTVHLSYGVEKAAEYVHQLAADHLVHAWDLAAATAGDTELDRQTVEAVAAWYRPRAVLYLDAGIVAAAVLTAADPQSRLIGDFGRDPAWGPNHGCLAEFSAAFGRGDVDAIMRLTSPDCVFEATGPAPDGLRHEGATAIRGQWEQLFGGTTEPLFVEEERFVVGDRGVLRWRFSWRTDDGTPGHVRGVDVLRLRDGLVVEKLSYVKG